MSFLFSCEGWPGQSSFSCSAFSSLMFFSGNEQLNLCRHFSHQYTREWHLLRCSLLVLSVLYGLNRLIYWTYLCFSMLGKILLQNSGCWTPTTQGCWMAERVGLAAGIVTRSFMACGVRLRKACLNRQDSMATASVEQPITVLMVRVGGRDGSWPSTSSQ